MSTKKIKQHIRNTKEIVRITNVMFLLAASKLSKVRKRRQQARRYFKELLHLVSLANANVKKKEIGLLTQRPTRNLLYVIITPDRGFCGGLPSTINRWATAAAEERQTHLAKELGGKLPPIGYLIVGKKGRDYIIRTKRTLVKTFSNTEPTWALALEITQIIVEAFLNEEVDAAFIVYAKSDLETPRLVEEQLVPVSLSQITLAVATGQEPVEPAAADILYFYSPKLENIFPKLVHSYLVSHIFGALLEGTLSEHVTRMVAMQQATKKAKEALDDLTVAYHVARQAQITNDLLEIASAAEALQQEFFP